MTKKISEEQRNFILGGLVRHPEIGFLDACSWRNIDENLAELELPEEVDSDGKPVRLPYNPKSARSSDGRFEYDVSLRRLLYPYQIRHVFMCEMDKRMTDFIRGKLRIFYSNGLVRKIEDKEELVECIQSAPEKAPSMLLRVQFVDSRKVTANRISKQPYYAVTLPILLIPGASQDADVSDFSRDNAFYELGYKTAEGAGNNLIGRFKRPVSREIYHLAVSGSKEEDIPIGCGC